MSVQYLTVQDVLFIHLSLTGAPCAFAYDKIEEGVFYQYAYGNSQNIMAQADRTFRGFGKLKPFGKADEATAFVLALAFAKLNGFGVKESDEVLSKSVSGSKISGHLESIEAHHKPDVQSTIREVIADYPLTIAALS